MKTLTPAIIFDIDGTLANIKHRIHFLLKTKPDWPSFKKSVVTDTPNQWCVSMIRHFINEIGLDIIFVTGRKEECREITDYQIKNWIGVFGYKLFMRQNKDHRPDVEIKEEIFINEIKNKHDVIFVVEDRGRVVEMWRNNGLVCLQCADGDF